MNDNQQGEENEAANKVKTKIQNCTKRSSLVTMKLQI